MMLMMLTLNRNSDWYLDKCESADISESQASSSFSSSFSFQPFFPILGKCAVPALQGEVGRGSKVV